MNAALGKRPKPTQADIDYDKMVRTAVGPWRRGTVLQYSMELGSGRVREDSSGIISGVSKKWCVFLTPFAEHDKVEYRTNGNRSVAEIKKI